jgi:nucleoid DNA-binding protein
MEKRTIQRSFDPRVMEHQENINPNEESALTKQIWNAFGRHIAKSMKAGKAVAIPKFGQFTFTYPNHLDMAGLTNPDQRDLQTRTPVFIVGKDFISGVKMRAGIANSMTHDIYLRDSDSYFTQTSGGGSRSKVLPFDVKHLNGIIPKHDISWTEVAVLTGNPKATKCVCKEHCELIIDKFSKKAHAGFKVDSVIPHVGRLSISIGICAVIFNDDIIGQSRGKTAINHLKRHHSAYIRNNLE